MTFNEDMQIDSSQSNSTGGRGRGPKIALGGGVGGLLILVVTLLLGGDPGALLGTDSSSSNDSGSTSDPTCQTGADANRDVGCRMLFTRDSLNAIWAVELPKQTGTQYVKPQVELFSGAVNTGCGQATSEVGPFYCPADSVAYIDTSFFDVLVTQFGSSGGPLAQEYVLAHEIGHHIQNLLGDIGRAQDDPRGPQSGAVRTELQADCYAGIWAHFADTMNAPGKDKPFLKKLTNEDINAALSAASAVGDDRIQKAATGRVNPEKWTHGASNQRQAWFLSGYKTGEVSACNTYDARDLNNP